MQHLFKKCGRFAHNLTVTKLNQKKLKKLWENEAMKESSCSEIFNTLFHERDSGKVSKFHMNN